LANLSIGQGQVLVTPLQMAVLAATVANAGKVPEPVLQPKMGAVAWRADLVAEGLPAAQIEQIREGMRRVVHATQGTGQAARIEKVIISGKTGTAQSWKRRSQCPLMAVVRSSLRE
jgi:cell division protein FtsI/penicillin-binding protein 2